ncbi:DNA replication complex GINS protein PSF3-like isoform X2 [Octopus sinensis]|uniref:DNA replication complex GINS protein PSF3 n=1 Tax=Octopus sinensis TaxID=2607531 RepID=A0A7E6EWT9_9MOLL|nr:DNA replication complex GINS protein PSF3-like isoform X2 [Octopus sinensis]
MNNGFLDPSSDEKDIKPGTKLEFPFWLAQALCSQKRHIISVELPKPYRIGYREVMMADASVVNLHKLGPYFYDLGCKLRYFPFTEIDDVAKSLLDTFQVRFRKILDASQSSLNEDTSSLTATLDSTEKFLFHTGLKSLNDFQSWETRRAEKLTSSEMVRVYRKRKREND